VRLRGCGVARFVDVHCHRRDCARRRIVETIATGARAAAAALTAVGALPNTDP
jgi:dihydroorotase-like cyclic amidohydrolase